MSSPPPATPKAPPTASSPAPSTPGTPLQQQQQSFPAFLADRTHHLLFRGWYTDRVFSEALGGYADRLQLDECETEAAKVLRAVHRRFKKETGKEDAFVKKQSDTVYLLVSWPPSTQPFGHYWFMVEGASIGTKGVSFKVKVVRSVLQADDVPSGKCPHCGKFPSPDGASSSATGNDDPLDLSEIATQLQSTLRGAINPTEWWQEARPYLTVANLVASVKFVVVLLMAMVSGLASMTPRMLGLLNRTIHESAFFIRNATPFLMGCLDVVNRAIAGLYTLVAMLVGAARAPPPPPSARVQAIEADGGLRQRYPYRRENVQRPYLQAASNYS